MAVNSDFRDLLSEFTARRVRFLVVGGYAVAFHWKPRFTKDLDLWIDPEPGNARRAWEALAAFGAPLEGVSAADLATPGIVYQMGMPPNRIDVLTRIEGLAFDAAWPRGVASTYGDVPVHYLSLADLIANKRAVGRPQDLVDAEVLEQEKRRRTGSR